jgi:hypothetical protein
MKLKDRARAKAERRAARRAQGSTGSGPPIATDEPGGVALAQRETSSDPDPT